MMIVGGMSYWIVAAAALVAVDSRDAYETEIRASKLSAAAGAADIHLAQIAPARFAAWERAARDGNAAALWLTGRCLVQGYGVASDPVKGAAMVRKAADLGYARAQFTLGQLYARGKGVAKDPVEAARCYQKAVDQGLAECYEWLALAYRNGTGVPKNPARAKELYGQAVKELEKAADEGIAGCQMRLGRVYTVGQLGVKPDFERGLKYYRMGLAQGHVWCQTNLGEAFQHGRFGLSKDLAEAARLYRLAAAQGDIGAEASLVAMYLDKQVPNPDSAEAARLFASSLPRFRKASAGHDAEDVQYALARMYETGSGVGQDDMEATQWLIKAAGGGSAEAMAALAERYENGRGVLKDPAAADALRAKSKKAR